MVIGGGPAGIAAAMAACARGARVAVIERQDDSRPIEHACGGKVCGGCLNARAIGSLRAVRLGSVLKGAVPLHRTRFHRGRRTVTIEIDGVAIGRDVLDRRMRAEAEAHGVEVRRGVVARDITRTGSQRQVQLECAKKRVPLEPVVAPVIIRASGLRREGRIQRIGFGAIVDPPSADRPEFERLIPAGVLVMHLAGDGYLGVVALGDGRFDVAAAVAPASIRASGGPGGWASRLLGAPMPASGSDARVLVRAIEGASPRGTPRLGVPMQPVGAAGELHVGDAEGYTEPLTGEGIGWAVDDGAAIGRLSAELPPDRLAERWRRGVHRRARRRITSRLLGTVARSPAASAIAFAVVGASPAAGRMIARRIDRGGRMQVGAAC